MGVPMTDVAVAKRWIADSICRGHFTDADREAVVVLLEDHARMVGEVERLRGVAELYKRSDELVIACHCDGGCGCGGGAR